ncbi:unnamed protein product [Meloidogyne enterolobii]|uniref:Uncharacterized protein n=1 Tax=Meloidogyne enterolobii TaxID=390850 RepID=A0ACB0Y7A6_MELEN
MLKNYQNGMIILVIHFVLKGNHFGDMAVRCLEQTAIFIECMPSQNQMRYSNLYPVLHGITVLK